MRYTNPPYDGQEDIPSSDEIREAFARFVPVDTGEEWYNVAYLKNDEPKRFVTNIKMNLQRAGYDVDKVFNSQRELLHHLKTNTDQLDFFRAVLLDFYRFTECRMEIHTIDVRHAKTIAALFKWQSGQILNTEVNTFLSAGDVDFLLVVEDKDNRPRVDDECRYMYTVYKSVEDTLRLALTDELGIHIDHLTQFLSSTRPTRPWRTEAIANMIKQRIAHVIRCIEYVGDRPLISSDLAKVMGRLRWVVDRVEQIVGIRT